MITHILKDGSKVDSIAGKVISSKEFKVLYEMLGGEKYDPVSASKRCSGDSERSKQSSFLP